MIFSMYLQNKSWPVLRAYNGFNPAMHAPDQFQSTRNAHFFIIIFYCYLFIGAYITFKIIALM